MAAVFLDPRDGRVVDQVPVGRTVDALFGSSVAVSPDRRSVAVTSGRAVTVLDTRTRRRVARLPLPLRGAIFVWMSGWRPDGSQLLLGTEGEGVGEVHVVDTETWEVVRSSSRTGGRRRCSSGPRTGRRWPSGVNYSGASGSTTPTSVTFARWSSARVGTSSTCRSHPDGRYLAAGRDGGGVDVLDTRTWQPVHEPAMMHTGHVNDVEWLPDSNTVVSAGQDEMVSLYDVRRDLVRASPLPASALPDEGSRSCCRHPTDEVVVFNEGGPGHCYPLDPTGLAGPGLPGGRAGT